MKILARFFYKNKIEDILFDDCFSSFLLGEKCVEFRNGKWIENQFFKFFADDFSFGESICFFDKKELQKGEVQLFCIETSYYEYSAVSIDKKFNLKELGLPELEINYLEKDIKLVNISKRYTYNHMYFTQKNASIYDLIQFEDYCIYLLNHAIKINKMKRKDTCLRIVSCKAEQKRNGIPLYQNERLILEPMEISLPILSAVNMDFSSVLMVLPMSLMLLINSLNMQKNFLMIVVSLLMPFSMFMNLGLKFHTQKKRHKKEINEYMDYLESCNQRIEKQKQIERDYLYRSIPFFASTPIHFQIENLKLFLGLGTRKSSIEIVCQKVPYNKMNDSLYKSYQNTVNQSLLLENAPIGIDVCSSCIILGKPEESIAFCRKLIFEFDCFAENGKIALLVDKEHLSLFSDLFYLPSLFTNGKRMIFTEERELEQCAASVNLCFSFLPVILDIPVFYFAEDTSLIKKKVDRMIFLHNKKGEFKTENVFFEFDWNEQECHVSNRDNLLNFHIKNETMYSIYEQQIIQNMQSHHIENSIEVMIGENENERIYFDLHEKGNGPHGIVAGTTGSGKTLFLISLILQLSSHYRPDDLSFLLMDFKGGDLTNAFVNDRYHLPHIAGCCTNLDSDLYRVECALQDELLFRQKLMMKTKEQLSLSSINIYDYQHYYHLKKVNTPCPHLVIVIDEFAELKTQAPEFMDYLIRIARIGRSLGIHLVLSTQRPSGILNDQIRANMSFSICLKVSSESDSKEVIGSDKAAYLQKPGEFYLQYNQQLFYGQNEYVYHDLSYLEEKKEMDVLNLQALPIETILLNPIAGKTIFSAAMDAIFHVCDAYHFPVMELWKQPLLDHYEFKGSLGMIDDPVHRRILEFQPDLTKGLLVVGAESQFIDTLISYSLIRFDSVWIISDKDKYKAWTNAVIKCNEFENIHLNLKLLQNEVLILDEAIETLNNLELRSEILEYQKKGNGLVILNNSALKLSYELIHSCAYRCLLESKDTNEMIQLFDEKIRIPFSTHHLCGIILDDEKYIIQMCTAAHQKVHNDCFVDLQSDCTFIKGKNIVGRSIVDFSEVIADQELVFVSNDDELIKRYKKYFPEHKFYKPSLSLKLDKGIWLGNDYAYQKVFNQPISFKNLNGKGVLIDHEKVMIFYLLKEKYDLS